MRSRSRPVLLTLPTTKE